MTKAELLEKIQDAIKSEESATTLYLKHLRAILGHGDFESRKVEKAKAAIEKLISYNSTHKSLLEGLRDRVEGEVGDAF